MRDLDNYINMLGVMLRAKRACPRLPLSLLASVFAAALSGRVLCLRLTPRALPWAVSCWPCRPFANTGL